MTSTHDRRGALAAEVGEGAAMERLEAQLRARPARTACGLTIRAADAPAAARIARRLGVDLHLRDAAEDGFVWAEFRPGESSTQAPRRRST